MRVEETLHYPAEPDAVFAMLCDQSWRERVCELAKATSYNVEVDEDGDETTVTVRRVMPADLPEAIQRFIGETVEVVQTERWKAPDGDGTRHADVEVRIVGQPASMVGTSTLRSTDSGSTVVVEGEVSVKVPFFGKKIEPEVGKAIIGALKIEEREGATYLT